MSDLVILILLWTIVSAFIWTFHRLQEVSDTSDASSLPKWARLFAQELKREDSGFDRRPGKIWRKASVVMFIAMLVFYLALDYTTTIPIRFGIGALCTLAFAAWAYYLDRRMIRVQR